VSTLAATVLGAAVAAAGVWLLRSRRALAVRANPIHVVTSRYLGAKRFLTIVEVDGERLLLGLAGDQVSLVTRLPTAPAPAEERA
jgi:flagellar biogenesis protein FliO